MQATTSIGTIVPATFSPLQDLPSQLLPPLPATPKTPRNLSLSHIITLSASASPPSPPSHGRDLGQPSLWGLTRDYYTTAAIPPPLIHIRTTTGIAQVRRSVPPSVRSPAQNTGPGRTRASPAPAISPPPCAHHRAPRALQRALPKARERRTLFAARSAAAFTQPSPQPPPSDLAAPPPLLPFPLSSYTTPPRRQPRSQTSPSAPTMPEYRHSRSGSLNNVSSSSNGAQATPMAPAATTPRFDGPRSPPNTAHVPCKFFRQGACQAGNACPFSHDLSTAAENVCKYFAKGNCKFGPKCANIHVLPDGRRINYGKNGVTIGTSPISLGGRANPASAQNQPSTSALTTSLYHADAPAYASAFPFDEPQHSLGRQPSLENGLPTIDMSYTSSAYGSPRDEETNRFGLGLSPVNKGLSVLDAPLPSSFDSNGISNAARFPAAPWPSSVPSKFGIESPSQSLSNAKDSRTSETLKLLHTSAFGSSEHLIAPIPNSPPSSHQSNVDEYFGKRAMHSSRFSKPRMLSSSMPKTTSIDRDWESEFVFADDDDTLPENYVPENLQDLLTPAEKARRGSMRADSSDAGLDGLSKYGSPIGTSPSRWGPMFQRQKEEEDLSRSARGSVSAFGHVGSPLRNSILAQEMNNNGLIRPSSLRSTSDSMSMLSQQLQRNHIDDTVGGASPLLHPSAARGPTSAISPISPIGKERGMERHVSSGSISSAMNGRFTTPINEDDEMFHMEGMEEDGETSTTARTPKRASGGLGMAWSSYAGVVSGKGGANGTKGPRDSVPVTGR
ncbi:hypothetical protein G7Z17_g8784 [Cylindrodendrum hubeiense]|uniref:C3H1-type domain-containing protein n=1 Tax=Cylindrodendrum hubeiense TaxID=595255 RepID=A0A9P5H0M7_9HYPO|nr:hypothetical protein G7Z17_g8784 [Cylindrodendrum hubeiense]